MAEVGAWLVGIWTGASGALAAATLKVAAGLALNHAVAKVTAPRGPRPQDLQAELRQSNAPRIRHLGRVRVAGAVMFWDWAQVGRGRVLHKLYAIGQGGLTGLDQVWLGDKPVERNGQLVTTAPWNGIARIGWRRGYGENLAGGAYTELQEAFPGWTAAHRLDGVGTLLARFDAVGGERIAEVYNGGEPAVTVLVRGDRCHQPGGGAFWSDNCAVQLRDVLIHPDYGPLTAEDLDLPSWRQAVEDCAEPVPTLEGSAMRYAGGGSYNLSEPVVDVARRISDAMGAQVHTTIDGKLGLRAGLWRDPQYTIRRAHIVSLDIGPGSGEFERVTALVPRYVAPEADWQESTADLWEDAAAIALYGEDAPKELDLPWVQHHGQARRLAKIKLARLNPAWRATIRLRFWGLLLLDQENVFLDLPEFGLDAAPAWIDSFAFDADGEEGVVTVSLIAADPASFEWAAYEEGSPPARPDLPDHADIRIAAPVIAALEVIRSDGPPYIRVTVAGEGAPEEDDGDGLPPLLPKRRWDDLYVLGGSYRRSDPEGEWLDLVLQQRREGGDHVLRTPPLADRASYDLRLAWYHANNRNDGLRASDHVQIDAVRVIANETAPAPPVLISAEGVAGGVVTIRFRPDLGAAYARTGLWRGPVGAGFEAATHRQWLPAISALVEAADTVPEDGARFWLRSENASGVASAPVLAIEIPRGE